jgi:hypothetical protein
MTEELKQIKEKIRLAAEHMKFAYETLDELYSKILEVEKRRGE